MAKADWFTVLKEVSNSVLGTSFKEESTEAEVQAALSELNNNSVKNNTDMGFKNETVSGWLNTLSEKFGFGLKAESATEEQFTTAINGLKSMEEMESSITTSVTENLKAENSSVDVTAAINAALSPLTEKLDALETKLSDAQSAATESLEDLQAENVNLKKELNTLKGGQGKKPAGGEPLNSVKTSTIATGKRKLTGNSKY